MSTTLSPSASATSSPIVLKRVKNIFGFGFGNEYGIYTKSPTSPISLTSPTSPISPSVILMKRKRNINNNNTTVTEARDNNDFAEDTSNINTTESVDIVPDDYYHRHREKKLEYQKNYNRENDDKIKEYNKDYYLKRRAVILEKAKTRVICECGCDVQLSNMNAHKKTKKHLKRVGTVVSSAN